MNQFGKNKREMNLATCTRDKKYAGTYTIKFILNREKPKYRRATYVRAVCGTIPRKKDNHRKRLTVGRNIMDYPVELITTTSYLTTIKMHVNIAISNITI